MDRMTFGKKTLNTQRARVDRFVAPRRSLPEFRRRVFWEMHCEKQQKTGEIWYTKQLQNKKYMNYLDEAFDLDPLSIHEAKDSKESHTHLGQAWPCVPRKRSYLSTADSILDLPTYSYATFPHLLDWGSDDVLVAALGKNYHKWSWCTQSITSMGFTQKKIQCCKFNPSGSLLLFGTTQKLAEIHDNARNKWLHNSYCPCFTRYQETCSITAIDWSPTGNMFVMGCSRGILSAVSRQAVLIEYRQISLNTILAVKVSPDARFVAAASLNGATVVVLSWPFLQLYSRLATGSFVKALSWHPWRSALLGIGVMNSDLQSHIKLWHIPSDKICQSAIGRGAHSLDAMLFNHRTGEMLLSLWSLDSSITTRKCSELVVMSDVDTVVDKWGDNRLGLDRVRTMVFSPDGTKLATATADEDLIIWNFLPEDKNNKTKYHKRFSAMPVFLDIAAYGFSLR